MAVSRPPKPLPVQIMRGIAYSPIAKRARIQGTGLEVWEIANAYESVDRYFQRLRAGFDWLTVEQLRVALEFADLDADFIAAQRPLSPATPQRLADPWEREPHIRPCNAFAWTDLATDDCLVANGKA